MEKLIDLHVHSTCSDGTYTPEALVQYAKEKGLYAFALTDHDTTAGISAASIKAKELGIELIPGVELSTSYKNKDIHILGLGIDVTNVHFQEKLLAFQDSRDIRNDKMIQALQDHGMDITREKLFDMFKDSIWTRAHFAIYLEQTGQVNSREAAFKKYIGDNGPCFIPREKVSSYQAVQLIHEGGGYAVLAHPLLYHLSESELDCLVSQLSKIGLDAIEAIYTKNKWMDESNMKRLARTYNLKITGGSDFHGGAKRGVDLGVGYGHLKIPYQLWLDLKLNQHQSHTKLL